MDRDHGESRSGARARRCPATIAPGVLLGPRRRPGEMGEGASQAQSRHQQHGDDDARPPSGPALTVGPARGPSSSWGRAPDYSCGARVRPLRPRRPVRPGWGRRPSASAAASVGSLARAIVPPALAGLAFASLGPMGSARLATGRCGRRHRARSRPPRSPGCARRGPENHREPARTAPYPPGPWPTGRPRCPSAAVANLGTSSSRAGTGCWTWARAVAMSVLSWNGGRPASISNRTTPSE